MDSRITALFALHQDDCLYNTLRPISSNVVEVPQTSYELPEYVREAWVEAYLAAVRVRKECAADQFGDPVGGFASCTAWRYLDCALLVWIAECRRSGGPVALLDRVRYELHWYRVFCDELSDIRLCQAMGFKEVLIPAIPAWM